MLTPRILIFTIERYQSYYLQLLGSQSSYFYSIATSLTEARHQLEFLPTVVIADWNDDPKVLYRFFDQLAVICPGTIKILMTSEVTHQGRIAQTLFSNLHATIERPRDKEAFNRFIGHTLETQRLLAAEYVKSSINELPALPTIPEVYFEIQKLMSTNAGANAIAKVIEKDQTIYLDVLKLANSAFMGSRWQVHDTKRAITVIGMENLRNLVLVAGVFKATGHRAAEIKKLQKHSIITGVIASRIVSYGDNHTIDPYLAYTAGLLHDIGRLLIVNYWPQAANESILDLAIRYENLVESEREVIHVDHQELGAYLLRLWNMRLDFVEVALYHHHPHNWSYLEWVIHKADYFCVELGFAEWEGDSISSAPIACDFDKTFPDSRFRKDVLENYEFQESIKF